MYTLLENGFLYCQLLESSVGKLLADFKVCKEYKSTNVEKLHENFPKAAKRTASKKGQNEKLQTPV